MHLVITQPTIKQLLEAVNEPVGVGTYIYCEASELHDIFMNANYKHSIAAPVFEAGVHVGLRLAELIRREK